MKEQKIHFILLLLIALLIIQPTSGVEKITSQTPAIHNSERLLEFNIYDAENKWLNLTIDEYHFGITSNNQKIDGLSGKFVSDPWVSISNYLVETDFFNIRNDSISEYKMILHIIENNHENTVFFGNISAFPAIYPLINSLYNIIDRLTGIDFTTWPADINIAMTRCIPCGFLISTVINTKMTVKLPYSTNITLLYSENVSGIDWVYTPLYTQQKTVTIENYSQIFYFDMFGEEEIGITPNFEISVFAVTTRSNNSYPIIIANSSVSIIFENVSYIGKPTAIIYHPVSYAPLDTTWLVILPIIYIVYRKKLNHTYIY